MTTRDCFIIMPISTPDEFVNNYSGDKSHFNHVLDHLFIPAIKRAGLNPIPPNAKGAELIQAKIISSIEKSECVLCDMSILNANVFFELGIRTAVNKPVALVKDDMTNKVPFDTSIINYHTYLSSLSPWLLDSEIVKLSDHISHCFSVKDQTNTLWKYFSLSSSAEPIERPTNRESKLDYVAMQVGALRKEFNDYIKSNNTNNYINKSVNTPEQDIIHQCEMTLKNVGYNIVNASYSPGFVYLTLSSQLPSSIASKLTDMAKAVGVKLTFYKQKEKN